MTELLIILALIVLNGVFAMSEMAIVSARRARLQAMAEEGDEAAQRALELAESPNRFLSTVQIGITLIGILAGAFGGASLSESLAVWLSTSFPILADIARALSTALVVGFTTYLSLVIGELVPKRLALQNAEAIAVVVVRPMSLLSTLATPIVWLLGKSTSLVLTLLGVRENNNSSVTEGEVLSLVREGTTSGVFEASEQDMVEAVFRLDEQRIGGLITPRANIIWLDLNDTPEAIHATIINNVYSSYPVCEGTIDQVVGIVRLKDIIPSILKHETLDLRALMHQPLYVPENVSASDVLQRFKTSGIHAALILSEFGDISGMVTLNDLMEEIVGEIEDIGDEDADREAVQRSDGSWLFDGLLPIYRLEGYFPLCKFPDKDERDYETLAGFILSELHRIPQIADAFEWQGLWFEVVDMDGKRIDKVLVKRLVANPPSE